MTDLSKRIAEVLALGESAGFPWFARTQEEWDDGFEFFEGPKNAFTFPVGAEQDTCDLINALSDILELLRECEAERQALLSRKQCEGQANAN
jgi:hypothetical protein